MQLKDFDLDNFSRFLHENECFKIGEFILKSRIKSPYYLDLRCAICSPRILENIANSLYKLTSEPRHYDIVCGVPYSGIPLATQYSSISNCKMILMRKEIKEYGTGRLVEGLYKKGNGVILIEDVISSGKSIIEIIEKLEREELVVKEILIVVDREMGGVEMLQKRGYNVKVLVKITDLLFNMFNLKYIDYLILSECLAFNIYAQMIDNSLPFNEKSIKSEIGQKLIKLMLEKRSNLCLSADVNSCEDLLRVADQCGPYIVVLKTHIDTLKEVNETFLQELRVLADKHHFFIFEDRKLCDIGNTVRKQADLISDWADIINMHSLSGEKSVESVSANVGLLLVGELSCEGNLIDYQYVSRTVDIAKKHSDKVFGFISQKAIGGGEFLYFTPGVKFNTEGDGMGQKYKTPEQAISEGADLIIVGRGILEADDVVEECKRYKAAGWEGYLKKLL